MEQRSRLGADELVQLFDDHAADDVKGMMEWAGRLAGQPGAEALRASLDEALDALKKDHAFLLKGGVFDEDFIEAYIALKSEEVTRFRMTTHPVEFDMYYSL